MTDSLATVDRHQINPCIVHQIQGRVRFRIYRLKADAEYAANLQQFLIAQPKINDVRVNRIAASIAIAHSYEGASLTEIASSLAKLIQQAATTELVPSQQTNSESENWSSLALPVFTTVISWLSNYNRWLWLRPVAVASLLTVTLPIAGLKQKLSPNKTQTGFVSRKNV